MTFYQIRYISFHLLVRMGKALQVSCVPGVLRRYILSESERTDAYLWRVLMSSYLLVDSLVLRRLSCGLLSLYFVFSLWFYHGSAGGRLVYGVSTCCFSNIEYVWLTGVLRIVI